MGINRAKQRRLRKRERMKQETRLVRAIERKIMAPLGVTFSDFMATRTGRTASTAPSLQSIARNQQAAIPQRISAQSELYRTKFRKDSGFE